MKSDVLTGLIAAGPRAQPLVVGSLLGLAVPPVVGALMVLAITGIGPFEVLLGRATAVQMTYNGTRVDVARVTTSDETAKVRLGNR